VTRCGVVLAAWRAILIALHVLFWKELSVKPEAAQFSTDFRLKGPNTWWLSLKVLGLMVVLLVVHRQPHWDRSCRERCPGRPGPPRMPEAGGPGRSHPAAQGALRPRRPRPKRT
jgi:hypothetical protein